MLTPSNIYDIGKPIVKSVFEQSVFAILLINYAIIKLRPN